MRRSPSAMSPASPALQRMYTKPYGCGTQLLMMSQRALSLLRHEFASPTLTSWVTRLVLTSLAAKSRHPQPSFVPLRKNL